MELLFDILAPVFAFLFGNFFNRWWNRGLPLLVLQGFSTFIEESTSVDYPDGLKELIDDSWYFDKPVGEKALITNLYGIYDTANYYQEQLEESTEKIDGWIQEIEKIITDREFENNNIPAINKTKDVVFKILNDGAVFTAIDFAIANDELHINLKDNLSGDIKNIDENLEVIDIEETKLGEIGFYVVTSPRRYFTLGSSLDVFPPFLKKRFLPYAKVLKALDTDILLRILKDIQPIIDKQARTARHIQENIKPLLADNKQWAARVRIENYGASPLIIFPKSCWLINNHLLKDCELLLQEEETNKEQLFKALRAWQDRVEIEDSKGKPSPIKGKYILGAGKKSIFWSITKQSNLDADDRKKLFGYFNNQKIESLALVRLNIERIGGVRKSESISSDELEFKGNLLFPKNPILEDRVID